MAPKDSHESIIYSAALIKGAKDSSGAKTFLTYLQNDQASDLFQKYGFKKLK